MTLNMGQLLSVPFVAVGLYFFLKARNKLQLTQSSQNPQK